MKKTSYLFLIVSACCYLSACDRKEIIFIPGEAREIYLKDWEKKELKSSVPKNIRVNENLGYETGISWKAPFSMNGKTFEFGNYKFDIASIEKINYKIIKNTIVFSSNECQSSTQDKKSNFEFTFNKNYSNTLKSLYFYKITSKLDDKASLISSHYIRYSCFFTSNFELSKLEGFITKQQNIIKKSYSLFSISREYWFAPLHGGDRSDFYNHSINDNWIKITKYPYKTPKFEDMVNLSNVYFIGADVK